ncbi:MAG: DUF4007 family protein [Culicoidibacterales bacterium]
MAAFGRHQSFYLRHRWISKGLLELESNREIFYKNEFETLGIGTNMMKSLRFWLEALELFDLDSTNKCHTFTELGKFIKAYDLEVSQQDTLALLHYQLVKNEELATIFYWYFNVYDKKLATRSQIQGDFDHWILKEYGKSVSANTLKRDVDCLVNMYVALPNVKDPEDITYSELAILPLLSEETKVVMKKVNHQAPASPELMMYVLLDATKAEPGYEVSSLSLTIDELLTRKNLWGKLFNMDRLACVNMLERLVELEYCKMTFTRTNNLDAITFKPTDALAFLKQQKGL